MFVATCSLQPNSTSNKPQTDCDDVGGLYNWVDVQTLEIFPELSLADANVILGLIALTFALAFSFRLLAKILFPQS